MKKNDRSYSVGCWAVDNPVTQRTRDLFLFRSDARRFRKMLGYPWRVVRGNFMSEGKNG